MKKIILLTALTLGALQAESVVHYDTKDVKNSQESSKPNHPNNDIYVLR